MGLPPRPRIASAAGGPEQRTGVGPRGTRVRAVLDDAPVPVPRRGGAVLEAVGVLEAHGRLAVDLHLELSASLEVQVLDALPAASEPEPACDLLAAASQRWVSVFGGLDGTPPRHRRTLESILARIPPPHTGAILTVAGHPVSCGRAVLEHTQIGLFDIATDSARRRQGYAGRLINGLLGWGRGGGARRAYLQVEADNTPARELYEKLGFREIYRYWYRVR